MKMRVAGAPAEVAEARRLFELWPGVEVEPEGGPVAPPDGAGGVALVHVASPADPALARVEPLAKEGWSVVVLARQEEAATRDLALAAGAVDVLFGESSAGTIAEAAQIDQGRRVRKEARFVTSLPWSIARRGGGELFGSVVDLSAGGFKLHSRTLVQPGENVRLSLRPPEPFAMLELHARILSAAAIDSGVWLRGRFVGLLADQREAIAAFLRSLDRPALDAAAALAAIDALRAGDLLDESPRAGIAAPKLIPREKEWIAAGDPLATVTLARCRGSMFAAVLSTSPPRVLPAFGVWRDEIRRAREQLYAQPGAESDPALKEVGARLEHAARFLEAVADRADEVAADGEALGELPLVAPQAAPSRPAPEPRAPTRAERIPMWVLWAIATGSLLGIGAYLVHVLRG